MTQNAENTQDQQPTFNQPGGQQFAGAQPRRLTRPREGRMLGGVCAGVAQYTGVDVTVVRLLAVASCLFGLAGVVVYLAGVILMPQE
ncbi:PspC domain-containing protein [Angustibacter sp. McL0619]|uniref:PspC domain-containing protein n=1 Tax=Angustibacter sp. McL0619 TaxID=3415676 RepID=UPI003CED6E24